MLQTAGVTADVYVDVVILVNFVMDFFVLWAAGKLARIQTRFFRLVLGALAGAAYALVVFLPESSFLTSLPAKLCCSVLMAVLAYTPLSIFGFLRSLCYLYLVTFVMGGAVIAAIYLTSPAPGYIQVWNGAAVLLGGFTYSWLFVGIVLAVLLGYGGITLVRRNWLEQNLLHRLVIGIRGENVSLEAFMDTGNQLSDPLTSKPVIVAEVSALAKVLPPELLQAVSCESDQQFASLGGKLEQEWASRLRLIPFNSVGREHGLMVGFRPDYVEVKSKNRRIICRDTVIGLVNRTFSKERKYSALLPPQLFEESV